MFFHLGNDFVEIFLLVKLIYLEWLIRNSKVMQFSLKNFTKKSSVNCLKHQLLN